jgi:hypothetical protein
MFCVEGFCNMKRARVLSFRVASLPLFMQHSLPSQAGRVVTKNDTARARQAIEREKPRKLVYSPNTVAILYLRENSTSTTISPAKNVITQESGNPGVIEQNAREAGEVKMLVRYHPGEELW